MAEIEQGCSRVYGCIFGENGTCGVNKATLEKLAEVADTSFACIKYEDALCEANAPYVQLAEVLLEFEHYDSDKFH